MQGDGYFHLTINVKMSAARAPRLTADQGVAMLAQVNLVGGVEIC